MMRGLAITVKPKLWLALQMSVRGYSPAASQVADKSLLSKLRKQTGIPFINCKKALVKFDNNFEQAKQWLLEEAQKEGWARATKLQARPMSQGLIAVLADNKQATMIEVNCETDFVARNEKFISMVTKLVQECDSHFGNLKKKEITLNKTELDQIKTSEQTTLADLVVLTVASLGENMSLRRGAYIRAGPGSVLASYVHPSNSSKSQKSILLGKYGSIVEIKKNNKVEKPVMSLNDLGSHICQHIVGMNPRTIGEYVPRENKKPVEEKQIDVEDIVNEDGSSEADVQTQVEVEEDKLLNQEFLLDTTMTVGELVSINGVEILQFRRFACGEEIEGEANTEQ